MDTELTCQISINLKQHSRSGSGLCFVSHSYGVSGLLRALKLFYCIIIAQNCAQTFFPRSNRARRVVVSSFLCAAGVWHCMHTYTQFASSSACGFHVKTRGWTLPKPFPSCMHLINWAKKIFGWLAQVSVWKRQKTPVWGGQKELGSVQSKGGEVFGWEARARASPKLCAAL